MNQPIQLSTRCLWLYHTLFYGALIGFVASALHKAVSQEWITVALYSLWSITWIYIVQEVPRLRTVVWVGYHLKVGKSIVPLNAIESVKLETIRDMPIGKIQLLKTYSALGDSVYFLPSLNYGIREQEIKQKIEQLQEAVAQAKQVVVFE